MSERPDSEHDGFEPALAAWMAAGMAEGTGAADDACLDANTLAAFAGTTLLEAERERVERHLAACRECRGAVAAALRAEPSAANAAPAPQLRTHGMAPKWWVAAAAAAIVVGVLIFARPDAPPTTSGSLLSAHAERLAREHPALFGGFLPLSEEERLARGDALQRGGACLESPAGTILSRRPSFAWTSGRPAALTVSTGVGRQLLRVEAVASPWSWPEGQDLDRGQTYLVELETAGVLGTERLSRTFTVASEELYARFQRQVEAVEADIVEPQRSLVLAHVALRHRLLGEARRYAQSFVSQRRSDRVGGETLFQVLTLIGHPDAQQVLEAD